MRVLRGLCLGLALTSAAPGAETPRRFEYVEPHMGVPVKIVLYAPAESTANKAAAAAYRKFADLNRVMSDYDSESELMRLCAQSKPGKPIQVSDDLFRVLAAAQELSRRSHGAFDVTVGPVVKLWRRARRRYELPDPKLLAEAKQLVGWRNVRLDPERQTVELLQPGLRLDLGGIAMGYAADEAMKLLREQGIERALIDASGDILVSGPPPDTDGWKVGLDPIPRFAATRQRSASSDANHPPRPPLGTGGEQESPRYLLLHNMAVTTSGDAFQHVEINGARYSHLIDPKTGVGLTDHSTVTVIAPTCTAADSLATTVSVLGPERGLKLIRETPHAEAFIVRVEDGMVRTYQSDGFAKSVRTAE